MLLLAPAARAHSSRWDGAGMDAWDAIAGAVGGSERARAAAGRGGGGRRAEAAAEHPARSVRSQDTPQSGGAPSTPMQPQWSPEPGGTVATPGSEVVPPLGGGGDDAGAPRSPADLQLALARAQDPTAQLVAFAGQMLASVKALPPHGNAAAFLCAETRGVLDSQALMLGEFSREKAARWAAGIYRSPLHLTSKIDTNQTTLGLVLLDDAVETVLPGGPAYLAGLQKGDQIVKVSTAALVTCGLWAPRAAD